MPVPTLVGLLAVVALAFVIRAALAVRSTAPEIVAGPATARAGLLPRTRLGWWSLALALVYVLLLVAMETVPGVDPFDSDPGLLEIAERLFFGATAAAAVVTGWIAVRARGDRALLLYIATAVVAWVGLVPVLGSLFFE